MLHQDDPLSDSIFDSPLSSSNQQPTMTTMSSSHSFYAPIDEDDPWSGVDSATYGSAHDEPTLNAESILDGVKLPVGYIALFQQGQRAGQVPLHQLQSFLYRADMDSTRIERLMKLVNPNNKPTLNEKTFYVALALAGCSQKGHDISFESLSHNRHTLPNLKFNDILYPHDIPRHKQVSTIVSPLDPVQKEDNQKDHQAAAPADTRPSRNNTPKTIDTRNWMRNVEEVKITIAPEREGFLFKHVNYIVENPSRSSIVLRRFSDFWWLMEAMVQRYPYRALPNIPPKKLSGRDDSFLEKRRKGLSRFVNAILRHPVLRKDEVVSRFLTEPSELVSWRKQYPPSLEEEYKRVSFPIDDMEQMIPKNLDEKLQKTRKRVDTSIEHYVNLCAIMGRMMLRMHGQSNDYARYSLALNSLAESEHRFHASECRNCQQVVKGYEDVAKHMHRESTFLEDQVNIISDGVVENLKRSRDLLAAFRDLDDRKERLLARQRPEVFTRRIAANRAKISQYFGVLGSEIEVERLEEAIRADEAEIVDQQRRQVFIRFCLWSEIIYLHKQQALVSELYRDYTQKMIELTRRRTDNWVALEEPVFEMPVELDLFE